MGVGNHIKGLELFRNLYTSDHQTAEPKGHSRPVETGTIDLAPCLSVSLAF